MESIMHDGKALSQCSSPIVWRFLVQIITARKKNSKTKVNFFVPIDSSGLHDSQKAYMLSVRCAVVHHMVLYPFLSPSRLHGIYNR